MLWKAKRKLTYKKVNHYYKEYRQIYRLRLEWLRWQESWQPLSTCETQIGICHQNQGYQRWAERAGKSCRFFAFVRSLIAQSLSSTRIMEPCIAWGHQNSKSLKNWSTNVSYGKIYKKWGLPWWFSGTTVGNCGLSLSGGSAAHQIKWTVTRKSKPGSAWDLSLCLRFVLCCWSSATVTAPFVRRCCLQPETYRRAHSQDSEL